VLALSCAKPDQYDPSEDIARLRDALASGSGTTADGPEGRGGTSGTGMVRGGSGGGGENVQSGDASTGPAGSGDGPVADPPEAPPPPEACGNGQIDPGETCDPAGDCPKACPEITCTRQILVGSPNQCNVRCQEEKITACASGDKCCPRGASPACNTINDAECAAVCGNGTVEAGETCEPKADCQQKADGCKDDRETLRTLSGDVESCTVTCTERKRPCQAGDRECPTTCSASTDPDCPGCGNGRIEAGEVCDPLSTCPSGCPTQGCRLRRLAGQGTCGARCEEAGNVQDGTACGDNRECQGGSCQDCGRDNDRCCGGGRCRSANFECRSDRCVVRCGPADGQCPGRLQLRAGWRLQEAQRPELRQQSRVRQRELPRQRVLPGQPAWLQRRVSQRHERRDLR
jgi:hypothetical protein